MKIIKSSGETIETSTSYAFEITDKIILDNRDSGNGLRITVGYESLFNNLIYDANDKAFTVNTVVSFLKDDNTPATNVIVRPVALRIDETTFVDAYGNYVEAETAGAITEYAFIWDIIHNNPQYLLATLFNGMKRAEYYSRYER